MFAGKSSFKNLFLGIFFLLSTWHFSLAAASNFGLNLQDKVNTTQESFLDVYYELLKNNHFGVDYQQNLIISTDIDGSFDKNGIILLGLIEYLQKRQDFDSKFLLERLNEYMSLKMHRFIASMDIPKVFQGNVWSSFYTLYEHKISLPVEHESITAKDFYPFRTTLSKAIISIQLILLNDFSYDTKKENLVFCLEAIKKELRQINQTLGNQDIDESYIVDFIKIMESYGLADQLVQPRSVKKIVVISLAVIVCIILAVIIIYKIAPNLPKSWDDFKNKVFELFRGIGKSASEGVIDAGVDRYQGNKETVQAELNQVLSGAIDKGMGPALDRVINGQPAGGVQPTVPGQQPAALVPAAAGGRVGLAGNAARDAGYGFVKGALEGFCDAVGSAATSLSLIEPATLL